jgi:hypothetical protein
MNTEAKRMEGNMIYWMSASLRVFFEFSRFDSVEGLFLCLTEQRCSHDTLGWKGWAAPSQAPSARGSDWNCLSLAVVNNLIVRHTWLNSATTESLLEPLITSHAPPRVVASPHRHVAGSWISIIMIKSRSRLLLRRTWYFHKTLTDLGPRGEEEGKRGRLTVYKCWNTDQ